MPPLLRVGLSLVSLVLLANLGCRPRASAERDHSAHGGGAVERSGPIELFSWWPRGKELDALAALMRVHAQRHPLDSIINASAETSGPMRKTLADRIRRREPPETFQANAGKDLLQWVMRNGIDASESTLWSLDEAMPADVAEWKQVVPEVVLRAVSHDGKLYAVPSDIHRINSVFYSKKVFERYGLTEPNSLAELAAIAERLRGTGVTTLALGTREPWTLALFVFECLLVAREGPRFYDRYLHGELIGDDERVVTTLRAALQLLKIANPDHANLTELQAVDLVVHEKAAMVVIGDWAKINFASRGMEPGRDYGEISFPGTAEALVFTSDTFSLPLAAKNKAGAIRLLQTIGSREAQTAMNTTKGCISPRGDVPLPDQPQVELKQKLLRGGPAVLALSGIVPPLFADDVAKALAEMAAQNDIEPAVQALRSRYMLLK